MNQRLVWNFEFTSKATLPLTTYVDKTDIFLKWEIRYFWPEGKPIILNTIDTSLLELTQYKQKIRDDYYYLLPGHQYNIKKRRDQLLYKPLLKQTKRAFGYGEKIILHPSQDQAPS